MHLIEPVRSCLDDIIQSTGSGMKSMVLDEFTTSVISAGYSRSDMLLREVYLFERVETLFDTTERLNIMKCLVILRPTKENVELLCRELNRPHYRTYHLYFTCRIGPTLVKRLAEADETEVVRCIREMPLDYQPLTPFLFTQTLEGRIYDLNSNSWLPNVLKRASDGLASVLIAVQINPIIRYQTQSPLCKALAEKVGAIIKNESMANKTWRQAAPFDVNSLLIIVDRRNDLITPIVNKWTYYSMIHEQFNISNNRISLIDVPSRKPKDPKEMLVSMENDLFFEENYYKNYGELGITLKEAVESLKTNAKSQHKVETMDDMRRFIEEYPETKRYASNLHNHVFVTSELTRLVTEHNLIALSECEQELAASLAHLAPLNNENLKKLKQYVSSSTVRPIDAIRLVSLFTVCRPDNKSGLTDLLKILKSRKDVGTKDVEFIKHLLQFHQSKPYNPLDETVQQVTRMIAMGVKGVDNVLTQHRPNLCRIFDELRRGNKLKESEFAFHGERYREETPKRVVVYYVGGITYDEALAADQINRLYGESMRVVVGGTRILNFSSFIEQVRDIMSAD